MVRLSIRYCMTFLIILPLFSCARTVKEITLYDLRCENLLKPLGIGTTSPLLSWKLKSTGIGSSQTAYQILVATKETLLNEQNADLWNSGKVASANNIMISFNGNKLISRSLCFWKVRIWDENDRVSKWSEVSYFSIGLLNKSDWEADYIGLPDSCHFVTSPQVKQSFTLEKIPEKAFLHVNSLGYHEVWINSKKPDDNVLAPAVSQLNKRSLIITYDISRFLKKGNNELVIWLGQGWYSKGLPGVDEKGPFVRAQVELLKNGNWETILATDSSWTGRKSGYSTIGTWLPGEFGGEQIEASLLPDDLSVSSHENAEWKPVIVSYKSGAEASPQTVEGNKIWKTIKAESVRMLNDSTWMVDIGTTLTGWFEITFPILKKGQIIKLEYCDHLDNEGNFVFQGQEDRYIAAGRQVEIFRNKFNYHGFRYVKISNLRDRPSEENIHAHLIHTGYNLASSFQCSDQDLNKIHDMILYTLRCLSLGGYLVDCPQIERLGYGGDGNASTETAQTMFDLGPLYSNWLQAWADCIREDGGMPHTAPNPYPAGGGPYWCGFIITAAWRTYKNYGNRNVLEKYYPVMQKWLSYVERYSPEGLLRPWPETDYRTWYLGDWATPEGVDQQNEASIGIVNNCFIAVCYLTMQKIATILDRNQDADHYSDKYESLRDKIQGRYYDRSHGIYGSGSQIDMTYPLLAGIVPDSLKNPIINKLHNGIIIDHNGHVATGLVGIPVFTEWAIINREKDLMYTILKSRGYPGYLHMLENGATTTWEHWNGSRSRIHNCYNGIGSWFYQAVGGILPDEGNPGYRKIIIDPQIPKGLAWAKTSKETPYGTVTVDWNKSDEMLRVEIRIPAGCKALFRIPSKTSWYKINGIKGEKTDFVSLESGTHTVECRE